jgi:hypothetical protein
MPLIILIFCLISTISQSAQLSVAPSQEVSTSGHLTSQAKSRPQPSSKPRNPYKIIGALGVAAGLAFGAYKIFGSPHAISSPGTPPPPPDNLPTIPLPNELQITQALTQELSQAQYAPQNRGYHFLLQENDILTSNLDASFAAFQPLGGPTIPGDMPPLTHFILGLWSTMKDLCYKRCHAQDYQKITSDEKVAEEFAKLVPSLNQVLTRYNKNHHEAIVKKCDDLMRIYANAQSTSFASLIFPPFQHERFGEAFITDVIKSGMDAVTAHAIAIKRIVDLSMSPLDLQVPSTKTLPGAKHVQKTKNVSLAPYDTATVTVANIFSHHTSTWSYIADLPTDSPLKEALRSLKFKDITLRGQCIDRQMATPPPTIAHMLGAVMLDSPNLASIASDCSRIDGFSSYKAEFVEILKTINPGYPDQFNTAFPIIE